MPPRLKKFLGRTLYSLLCGIFRTRSRYDMNNTGSRHSVFNAFTHAYENVITNSVFRRVNFAEVSLFLVRKMSHNWRNYIKILKFSDAKNTKKIDAFFSKQKSSETWELEVHEQSENRPSSSADTVIDFIEQSESRPSASIS